MPTPKDLPGLKGPGVGQIEDTELTELAEEFIEVRDKKSTLAERTTALNGQIIDRMKKLKLKAYRFGDQLVEIKPGQAHVKIKAVKAKGVNGEEPDEENQGQD